MQFSMYYVDCATRNYRLWYNVVNQPVVVDFRNFSNEELALKISNIRM